MFVESTILADSGCFSFVATDGTAPGDFRGTGKFRMVISVYMGDFTNDEMLNRKSLKIGNQMLFRLLANADVRLFIFPHV